MLSHVIPWPSACQAPLSIDFSRQESWSGLPFPSPFLRHSEASLSGLSPLPQQVCIAPGNWSALDSLLHFLEPGNLLLQVSSSWQPWGQAQDGWERAALGQQRQLQSNLAKEHLPAPLPQNARAEIWLHYDFTTTDHISNQDLLFPVQSVCK